MSGRVTLVLLLLAFAAAGYVFGIDQPRRQRAAEQEASAKKVLSLTNADVKQVELPLADAKARARVVRDASGEGWKMSAPLETGADEIEVEGILSMLTQLQLELEIERDPEKDAAFGLDEAKVVVLTPKEGEPIRLVPGGDTPVGSLRYLTVSTRPNQVLGVRGLSDRLQPELLKLRDKSITSLEPQDVRRIEIERPGSDVPQVRLEHDSAAAEVVAKDDARFKGEGAWRLREPVDEVADSGRIDRLLQDLYFARAQGIEDPPFEPARFGLDAPQARIRLVGENDEADEIVLAKVDEAVYARVDGEGPALRVEQRLLEIVPTRLFDYRFKRVLSVRRSDVDGVRIRFPRADREIRIDGEDEDWVLTSDSAAAQAKDSADAPELDNGRVEGLIQELDFLEAKGAVDSPDLAKLGLEKPVVRVEISRSGEAASEPLWLELGDRQSDGLIPARASNAERVWLLEAKITESLPYGPETFEDEWLVPVEPGAESESSAAGTADPPAAAKP